MKSVIIIGAGLGGLTAGALLAKKGHKVTILEQHSVVGGCATTFVHKNEFVCEVSLHKMDAVFDDKLKKEIFETLDVYNHITFVSPHEFFRLKTNEIDFYMPYNSKDAIETLSAYFPKEKENIKSYFTLISTIATEYVKLATARWWEYLLFPFLFKTILRYKHKSTKEIMDRLFKDEKLKLILNANVGYYSDTIAQLSFLYHSIGQDHYFRGRGWYIQGGSQKLSDYLAQVIRDNHGTILCSADVIEMDDNTVTYEKNAKRIDIKSDIIISNLSPAQTYKFAKIPYTEKKKVASSLLSIYIGFNKNLKTVYGKSAYSTFFLGDVNDIQSYDKMIEKSVIDRGFIFVDYSQVDAGLTHTDKSFGMITLTDYLEDWESLSTEAYVTKKKDVLEVYLRKLEKEYPHISEHIEFAEVGTAKTMQRYLKTPNGTAYGFAPTPKDFFRIPQVKSNKMKNLYFVGAWVIGGGFTPAILSGGLCAKEILKRNKV